MIKPNLLISTMILHSMATVCGCCLAMLDAGVPLKTSVAGVAMGLILGKVFVDIDV